MHQHYFYCFDYNSFQTLAAPLAEQVQRNNLSPLAEKVITIATTLNPDTYILKNVFTIESVITKLQTIDEKQLKYRNITIGDAFMLLLSTYLRPLPQQIGFQWRILGEAFIALGWDKTECDLLLEGHPVGSLFYSELPLVHKVPTYDDPFWRWIRLPGTFNQGGWLSLEACLHFRNKMREVEPVFTEASFSSKITDAALANEKYQILKFILDEAIRSAMGLYTFVTWGDEIDD